MSISRKKVKKDQVNSIFHQLRNSRRSSFFGLFGTNVAFSNTFLGPTEKKMLSLKHQILPLSQIYLSANIFFNLERLGCLISRCDPFSMCRWCYGQSALSYTQGSQLDHITILCSSSHSSQTRYCAALRIERKGWNCLFVLKGCSSGCWGISTKSCRWPY